MSAGIPAGMPVGLTYAIGRLGAILFGHFDPEDADCTAAAAQSKVPIFFIHGDADGFVPMRWGGATMRPAVQGAAAS